MNEKLTIQDLIDMLTEKHGMSKKNADNFVKDFFLLIEESLEKDRYVKIRGLGTFKLIDVESRESVNVNTGERFEIQGHTKVSFTPEASLKEIINKPFSHFETVALNENTILENTSLENENEDEEEIIKDSSELPITNISSEVDKKEEVSTDIQTKTEDVKEVPEVSEPIVDTVEEAIKPEQIYPIKKNVANVEKETSDSSTMKYFMGIVIFIVVLCGAAVGFMYYPEMLETVTSKPTAEEPTEPTIEASVDETVLMDTLDTENTVDSIKDDRVDKDLPVAAQPITKKEQKKVAVPFTPDSVGYIIDGTEAVYTIKEGETLIKVALRFYGTKTLWPFIVKHNPDVIKNPDNVPFGTTIKIPKLVRKQ